MTLVSKIISLIVYEVTSTVAWDTLSLMTYYSVEKRKFNLSFVLLNMVLSVVLGRIPFGDPPRGVCKSYNHNSRTTHGRSYEPRFIYQYLSMYKELMCICIDIQLYVYTRVFYPVDLLSWVLYFVGVSSSE